MRSLYDPKYTIDLIDCEGVIFLQGVTFRCMDIATFGDNNTFSTDDK